MTGEGGLVEYPLLVSSARSSSRIVLKAEFAGGEKVSSPVPPLVGCDMAVGVKHSSYANNKGMASAGSECRACLNDVQTCPR